MRITEFPMIREIKDAYAALRQEGLSRDCAAARLQETYAQEIHTGAEDDGLLFRIALADAQYALKELSEAQAGEGLAALEQISRENWQITPGDLQRRREWYAKAPMPERRHVRKPRKFRCGWEIGDTFAYQLLGKDAEEFGLSGRYILFRKVSEAEEPGGVVTPVVTVSIWDDKPLPTTAEEFLRLPILKLDNGRANTPRDKFVYRTEMLIESETMLRRLRLRYLGNFADVPLPEDEAVISYVGFMKKLALNLIDISCCHYWRNHQLYEKMARDIQSQA